MILWIDSFICTRELVLNPLPDLSIECLLHKFSHSDRVQYGLDNNVLKIILVLFNEPLKFLIEIHFYIPEKILVDVVYLATIRVLLKIIKVGGKDAEIFCSN